MKGFEPTPRAATNSRISTSTSARVFFKKSPALARCHSDAVIARERCGCYADPEDDRGGRPPGVPDTVGLGASPLDLHRAQKCCLPGPLEGVVADGVELLKPRVHPRTGWPFPWSGGSGNSQDRGRGQARVV